MAKGPVTDAERERVRQLHAQGLGRNEIAAELGRSAGTITTIAKDLGLSFDRAATQAATQARKIDLAARRAAIVAGLYDVAEEDLAYLKQGRDYEIAEVSMGAVVRYKVNRLPAHDRKALISGISTATSAAARIEAVDAGDGSGAARSLVGQLAAGLTAAYRAMNEGAGDAP